MLGERHYWHLRNNKVDDFVWLIMGFFFYHFKGLHNILNIIAVTAEEDRMPNRPLLAYLIKDLFTLGKNRHEKVHHNLGQKFQLIRNFLDMDHENIDEFPITWHPYTDQMLPPDLHDQIQYRTIVTPLFCYNYVEPHYPNVIAKQFAELDDIDLTGVGSDMGVIISKGNKGNHPIKFKEHFKRELRQWEDIDRLFAQNFQTIEASTSETAGDHESPNIEYSTSGAYRISVVEETNIQLKQNEVELNDNVEIVNDIEDENAGRDGFRRVRRRGRGIATPPAPLTSDRRERKKPDKFTHSTDHVKAIRAKTKRK